jgi:UDP-N-acetylglucosamine 2-epimerase (non-hydrolysing)
MRHAQRQSPKPKILAVFGTRPEVIKLAPVIREIQGRSDRFSLVVCNTGQHRELVDQALSVFQVRPDYNLGVMKEDQPLSGLTSRVLEGLDPILREEGPDFCLVQGDTTTAFAAALSSFYRKTAVGHVEAGLRTRKKYGPFPEEVNRQLISRLADLHFAPTRRSAQNLIEEGVPPEAVVVTGNTAVDAVLQVAGRDRLSDAPETGGPPRRNILATIHRRENWGGPLRDICEALREIVRRHEDVEVTFSVHPNPNVKAVVEERLSGVSRVRLIDPPDYLAFVRLLRRAKLVLTDSGGLQEEAPVFHIPVLVAREETERVEAVEAGTVKVVGARREGIVSEVGRLLDDSEAYDRMARAVNPYGDGRAALRILEALSRFFGLSQG